MDLSKIKALTFDVFGTVVDWRGGLVREGQEAAGEETGEVDWNAFAVAWKERSKMAGSVEEADERARRSIKADDLNRDNLLTVLREMSIGGISGPELDHLSKAWHRLDPWPDSGPGMKRLRKRFVLAAVSSGNVALLVEMARRSSLPWDAILCAEVTGYYKPRPEAYLRAVDMLGLSPNECMMVASHNDDLAAAAACGLRTAFIRRPLEDAEDQIRDREAAEGVDIAVDSMVDLAVLLGC